MRKAIYLFVMCKRNDLTDQVGETHTAQESAEPLILRDWQRDRGEEQQPAPTPGNGGGNGQIMGWYHSAHEGH